VSLTIVVAWKRKEERRTIESMLLAKLRKLLRRRLFTKYSNSRIAGYEFN